jgi:hypothetical protein
VSQLPFLYNGELQELNGTVIEGVSCSVWPAERRRDGRAGEVFDHTGEVPLTAAEALTEHENVTLVVLNGPLAGSYRVVDATAQTFTRHVGLELAKVKRV